MKINLAGQRISPALTFDAYMNIREYLKINGYEKSLSLDNSIEEGYILIKRKK